MSISRPNYEMRNSSKRSRFDRPPNRESRETYRDHSRNSPAYYHRPKSYRNNKEFEDYRDSNREFKHRPNLDHNDQRKKSSTKTHKNNSSIYENSSHTHHRHAELYSPSRIPSKRSRSVNRLNKEERGPNVESKDSQHNSRKKVHTREIDSKYSPLYGNRGNTLYKNNVDQHISPIRNKSDHHNYERTSFSKRDHSTRSDRFDKYGDSNLENHHQSRFSSPPKSQSQKLVSSFDKKWSSSFVKSIDIHREASSENKKIFSHNQLNRFTSSLKGFHSKEDMELFEKNKNKYNSEQLSTGIRTDEKLPINKDHKSETTFEPIDEKIAIHSNSNSESTENFEHKDHITTSQERRRMSFLKVITKEPQQADSHVERVGLQSSDKLESHTHRPCPSQIIESQSDPRFISVNANPTLELKISSEPLTTPSNSIVDDKIVPRSTEKFFDTSSLQNSQLSDFKDQLLEESKNKAEKEIFEATQMDVPPISAESMTSKSSSLVDHKSSILDSFQGQFDPESREQQLIKRFDLLSNDKKQDYSSILADSQSFITHCFNGSNTILNCPVNNKEADQITCSSKIITSSQFIPPIKTPFLEKYSDISKFLLYVKRRRSSSIDWKNSIRSTLPIELDYQLELIHMETIENNMKTSFKILT